MLHSNCNISSFLRLCCLPALTAEFQAASPKGGVCQFLKISIDIDIDVGTYPMCSVFCQNVTGVQMRTLFYIEGLWQTRSQEPCRWKNE